MLESAFFQDLGVMMLIVAVAAAIFSRLGWPKAIGYILAGVLMSQHTWGGSFLCDPGSICTMSQLGVVFLMFGMGLDFSAKDMKKVKSVAAPAAIVDVVIMTTLGWLVGTKVFHWNNTQSFFLGVAICDSATTLLAKVINEMGWGHRPFSKFVLGTSVIEDILCIGAIAVATGCARGSGFSVGTLASSLGWLAMFFVFVLIVGLVLVPRLLKSIGKRGDGEALLLVTMGCCFLVTYAAHKFDYSAAIGAFLVGFICAMSVERFKLGAMIEPLKSLFSAMFFATIGLLVNPVELWHCLPQIIIVALVVIVGKGLNNLTMSLATGLDIKTSVQNAMSLAQIGEFAFMTAILYAGLVNDTENTMFPVAVGASLLTTLLNPAMIRFSDKVGNFAVKHTPQRAKRFLTEYQSWLAKLRASKGSESYRQARRAVVWLIICEMLILNVSMLVWYGIGFDFSRFSVFFEHKSELVFCVIFNLFVAAMQPIVYRKGRDLAEAVADMIVGKGDQLWRLHARRLVQLVVWTALAIVLLFNIVTVNLMTFDISPVAMSIVLGVMTVVCVLGWQFFAKIGRRASDQLYEAMTNEDRLQSKSDQF